APKAGSETIIAAAFSSLLGCDVQDADADFFALGGHSLLAMKLLTPWISFLSVSALKITVPNIQ
ncbi:hypothetical protein J4Y01_16615, partial [Escherichia coli]